MRSFTLLKLKILTGFAVRILSCLSMLFLASCATTPEIHLKTGDMSMEVKKREYFVTSNIVYSPDGKSVLSGNWDGTIRLWDVTSGRLIKGFKGHKGHIVTVAFSPDGKTIATGGNDGIVKLWDAATGKEIRQFTGYYGSRVAEVDKANMSYSPNGRYIMVPYGSTNGGSASRLYEVQTGKVIREFQGYFQDFSPDGKYALFFSRRHSHFLIDTDNTALYLVDVETGKERWRVEHWISNGAVFSPDNRYILVPRLLGKKSFSPTAVFLFVLLDTSTGRKLKEFGGDEVAFPEGVFGGLLNMSFSPDSRYVLIGEVALTGYMYKLWDIEQGTDIKEMQSFRIDGTLALLLSPPYPSFSRDGMFAVMNNGPNIKLYDISSGEELANFIGFEDGEWLVITPNGYYNSSEKGAQYLSVKVEDKKYDMNLFYDVFYRPDIVAAKLRGDDIKDLITITMKEAIKSPPPVVEISPITASPASPKAKVCYNVKSTGGGIGEVRLFHNGKLIESDGFYKDMAKSTSEKTELTALNSKTIYEDMRSVKIKEKTEISPITTKTKGEVFNDCKEIEAIAGENEISITAFNKDNTVQGYMQTAKFNSTTKQEEPYLYILSIGIDQYKDNTINLKYAVKDSKDIEEKILKQAETLYKPQNIHYELLTDNTATKANIINRITDLSKKIKPTDSFILFVAGHGVLLQNQYYMLTSEYDGNVNENNLISSNEIVEISKKIKSLSQLFIFDTCHAGGVDYIVSGLYDARMSVLAKKMGLHIYASASDKQSALDGYEGNGLFTYTLLDGLNNNRSADKNGDKNVSLIELGEYSKITTTEISKKIGHTQTPLIINFGKDNAVYQLR